MSIHIPNMHKPSKPPGPAKRFNKYFTVPITLAIKEGFEKVKWRTRLDKTEVARRVMEYFLTMPAENQDKIMGGFDSRNKLFQRKEFKPRVEKPKLKTVASLPQPPRPMQVPQLKPVMLKRSILDGLD